MSAVNSLADRSAGRSAGRPKQSVLSHQRIVDAAFALTDKAGVDFTLAALARSLDVRPSALHHYFASRADLIAAMRGNLAARLSDHGFSHLPWHVAIIPWAHEYLESFGNRPGVIAAMAVSPLDGEPESMRDYERVVTAFERDGYPQHLIVPAFVAIESFIIGSALDAIAPTDNMAPGYGIGFAPRLTAAESVSTRVAESRGMTPSAAAFDLGLRALVAGLRAIGDSEPTSPPGTLTEP